MDIQGLKAFVLDNDLEQRSISRFWNYFNNWKREYVEEFEGTFPNFNPQNVEVFIDTVSLRITNWPEEGYNHVILTLRIHYEGFYSGIYQMVYNIDGSAEDDHLSIG
ncbi:hypothetical protein [Paenibacillus albus]|uniref:Uncharacterized protein n=1 Tax=Paenibacillus albus TaxID=2495582 RepID=A0A3Q8X6W3_9BACL|nr:hypothetical protein [Paenibacillus albus]AZN41866.1 hypothetical protein EJC50_20955 [Paenibacillus albus]